MNLDEALERVCNEHPPNQLAMKVLYCTYFPRFERYLRLRHRLEKEDCEDVIQEAWIKIFRNLRETAEVPRKRDALFFTVLTNTALDHHRKRGRSPNVIAIAPQHEPAVDDVRRIELLDCMTQAFAALRARNPEDAGLLSRVTLSNGDMKSLANELAISYAALRQRLRTARQRLSEHLERLCPEYAQ